MINSCWRIINDGAGDAAYNMAADEALFEAVATNAAPPALRLYEWEQPSVSLGRFQSIERTVKAENCQRLNVPLVRRITGGRGILHGHDLTVSIAGVSEPAQNTLAIYEWLASGFIAAFRLIGVETAMGACTRQRTAETRGDCFACISQADVVDTKTGQKLLGAALHRRENYFLLQASIPFPQAAEHIHANDVFTGKCAELNTVLCGIEKAEFRRIISKGFKNTLHLRLDEADLSLAERKNAENLVSLRYRNEDWMRKTTV